MKKIIIILILLFSINLTYASKNNNLIYKLVKKINTTKYKEILPKIDKLVLKTHKTKLDIFYKKLEKVDFKNKKLGDKKYLLIYLKIKVKNQIDFLKEEKEKKLKYNGIDISKNLKQKHLQNMHLSCEISASSDILTYLTAKKITEKELLKILDKSYFNKLPKRLKNGEKIWGNPQKGFVGYIDKLPNGRDAMQGYMTGYGVLENPIAKIYNSYGFETKIKKDGKISPLLEELHKGNMVQLWGDICTNPKYYSGKETICKIRGKLSWNYKRQLKWKYKNNFGKYENYIGLNGEHAFYLLGYKGNYKNPTHIILWDTMTGRHIYSTSEWMRKWGKMQYRSIIIYSD